MGVSGLLPLLKSIQRPIEIKKYHGQILGIDGYGWLHRAAYSCALELGQDIPTDKYVTAVLHRVKMLIHYGVKPYMVFDGDYLPSKARTEESRAKSRDAKKKLAMELLKAGKPAQATQEFQKCIDITPEMASAVIHQLKKMDIDYVVAPYEADSQLVYLERKGIIDGIISDDSDLLVFGAKRLLTKLDKYGNCMEINRRDFCACREVSLTGWTDQDFRRMAIMSGCDYLDGLPSVGLKTAYRMMRKSKTPERVVRMLQFQGKRVSENYLTEFYKAELTFLHQWVFCPTQQTMVHLTDLDGTRTAEEMPYIGSYKEDILSRAIAKGDVNPITGARIIIATTPTKRRHSQTTSALTHARKQSQSQAQSQARTPAKPINSYFKGYSRIPMGEMDSNCFSVDPQRIAQITDGGLVPRVFPLPRPYIDEATQNSSRSSPRRPRRRTEPIPELLAQLAGESTPIRRTTSIPSASASKVDQPNRPSKKARLCEDGHDQDGSPKQSKFFAATPLKVAKSRRVSGDSYLIDDDSFEEALLSLPDIDGWTESAKSRKSISVFTESVKTAISQGTEDEASAENSQQTVVSEPSFSQQSTAIERTQSMMPPPKPTGRLSLPVKTPSRSLSSLYSFSSRASVTPASSVASSCSSVFSMRSTPSTVGSNISTSRPTPLQRMASKALGGSSSPRPKSSLSNKKKAFTDGLPVNPSFVPLPKVNIDELEALNRSCGSEDQIIPDSDGEDEIEASPPTKLNLSRFAFA